MTTSSYTPLDQPRRTIGASLSQSDDVPVIGLGCMGMSDFYGARDQSRAVQTLEDAMAMGVTHWDTSDMYGPHTNEKLLGEVLASGDNRSRIFLATKFAIRRDEQGNWLGIDGSPAYARQCCEDSLRRLGVEQIDLYYMHRPDPNVPIEETIGTLADLKKEGKIKHIGLSEHDVETLRRAHAEHPISAYQGELSLWTGVHEGEGNVIEACKELDIAFVAYSPLGRGFLTGSIKSTEDLDENDWRRTNPRFQGENFERNMALVEEVEKIAAEIGCSAAQVCLSWILTRYPHTLVIPGTTRSHRVEENARAASITLSSEQMARLNALPDASGARYA